MRILMSYLSGMHWCLLAIEVELNRRGKLLRNALPRNDLMLRPTTTLIERWTQIARSFRVLRIRAVSKLPV